MEMKKLAISGPEAPPMVLSSFMPMRWNACAGASGARSAFSAAIASQPRRTLMKWSPSPMARSSDSICCSLARMAACTASTAATMS